MFQFAHNLHTARARGWDVTFKVQESNLKSQWFIQLDGCNHIVLHHAASKFVILHMFLASVLHQLHALAPTDASLKPRTNQQKQSYNPNLAYFPG